MAQQAISELLKLYSKYIAFHKGGSGGSKSLRYIQIRRSFFRYYATFFLFVSIEAPSRFLPETKRFANIEESLGFSGQCEFLKTIFGKNSKIFLKTPNLNFFVFWN